MMKRGKLGSERGNKRKSVKKNGNYIEASY